MLVPFAALAAEAPPPPPGVSFATMMQTVAGLALILGLFVGTAWLLRKINGGKPLMANNGPLKILSSLTVGARERIILVEVENTWLIVGVAPGHIRTLHTLPKGAILTEPAEAGQFGHWLKKFREQRNDTKQ
ncbi:MAG: flagellar biosynthetic protein FliO [Betaproteobacteria bacterium]|jgi:flagellar protein FliO/FliZ|nr:flagellar biosynthetic protein FliO [Betaproteobacteria bacterium]